MAITKKIHFDGYSGVVITGFGEKEVFPKLAEYRTDLVIFNKVRKIKQQKYKQHHRSFGKVMSFAQDDITRTILEGIYPNYAEKIRISAYVLLNILPEVIIDGIAEFDRAQKKRYKSVSQNASLAAVKLFLEWMDKERQEKHTFQIERAIQFMPFSELAEVAELFIRLTQIRQRLSIDSETVGGPIDVAVISKADEFTWVKRKFYFSKELNYAFFW